MSTHPKNACPSHEWEPSLVEAGRDVCAWCGAERETPPAPVRGIDFPVSGPVAAAVKAAA